MRIKSTETNKSIFIVFLILYFTMKSTWATGFNQTEGRVYYFDFDIQRITGIPEHQIEQYGCLYMINKIEFEKLIVENQEGRIKYNKNDIRGKVVFSGNDPYFISVGGVVRQGVNFSTIRKKDFVDLLSPIKEQKCR